MSNSGLSSQLSSQSGSSGGSLLPPLPVDTLEHDDQRDVNSFENPKGGGKVTIIANKNRLVRVRRGKKNPTLAETQEEARKKAQEERFKKEDEDEEEARRKILRKFEREEFEDDLRERKRQRERERSQEEQADKREQQQSSSSSSSGSGPASSSGSNPRFRSLNPSQGQDEQQQQQTQTGLRTVMRNKKPTNDTKKDTKRRGQQQVSSVQTTPIPQQQPDEYEIQQQRSQRQRDKLKQLQDQLLQQQQQELRQQEAEASEAEARLGNSIQPTETPFELSREESDTPIDDAQRRLRRERDQRAQARRREAGGADIQLQTGWTPLAGFQEPAVYLWENICFVAGAVKGNGTGVIATLGPRCRPKEGTLTFAHMKGDAAARVDVTADGKIIHVTGGGVLWLSLSGIWFTVDRPRAVNLVLGWQPLGNKFRSVTQSKNGDLCMISGAISGGKWEYFADMAVDCIPQDGRPIFSVSNHDRITRVDVMEKTGLLIRQGGYANHGWLSLDGIAYTTRAGAAFPLSGDWLPYEFGYRAPTWKRVGPICVVSGAVRSQTWPEVVGTLPLDCRPDKKLIFGANVHMSNAVVEVFADGKIIYRKGTKQQWDWMSLEGIRFFARS